MDIVRKGSYRNVLGRTILFAAEKFCGSFVGFGYAEGVAGADGKPQAFMLWILTENLMNWK